MTICKHCGATNADKIEALRALHAHRKGIYAEQYRVGLSVAAGAPMMPASEISAALASGALGQGYRDGLAIRPYNVRKKGAGSAAKDADRQRARRKNKSKIVD